MNTAEPQPLWREAIPDPEPWRRGRTAVVLIGVLIIVGEIAMIISAMMESEIETMLVRIITTWGALLVLYLIWIGQNWARWIIAPIFAAHGCWDVVWGIIGGGNELLPGRARRAHHLLLPRNLSRGICLCSSPT